MASINPRAAAAEPTAIRSLVLVRLAVINSIGYCGSTIVPLWVGDAGPRMGMPIWFGSAVASAQLATAAIFNLLTPLIFGRVAPARVARIALPLATLVFALASSGDPFPFVLGCVGGGAMLGIVLNATNRIVAASAEVQKGYATFLISECLFSASMFYAASLLARRSGAAGVFLTLPAATSLGCVLLFSIAPSGLRAPPVVRSSRWLTWRSALALAGILLFFAGQSSINASTLALAAAVGLAPSVASAALSVAIACGVAGGIGAHRLGERFGTIGPILGATLTLAAVLSGMTLMPVPWLFLASVGWVQLTTFFIVPYFFALLATLDPSGRTASVGPAFLLLGVGLGPSLGVAVSRMLDLAALGPVATAALILSAICMIAAACGPQAAAPHLERAGDI